MAIAKILRTLRVVMNDDGTIRAVIGEYDEKDDATGRIGHLGTMRISQQDIATALPSHAALIAAVDAALSERDAAIASRDAAIASRVNQTVDDGVGG